MPVVLSAPCVAADLSPLRRHDSPARAANILIDMAQNRIIVRIIRSTEGAVMRRHASGIGRGARGRGMNAPPKLPGGAGAPPGDARGSKAKAAQKGSRLRAEARRNGWSESAARRRQDVAMERRTARTRRHGCPRRKAWRLKGAPLGAPSHRIAEGGRKGTTAYPAPQRIRVIALVSAR